MTSERKLSESTDLAIVIDSTDIKGTGVTSAWLPVADYRRIRAVGKTGDIATTKIATLKLKQAKDSSGTTPLDLGTADVRTASGTQAFSDMEVEAHVDELAEDYTHVAVFFSSDNSSAVTGSAAIQRGEKRYTE